MRAPVKAWASLNECPLHGTVIVGGGPAGTALLVAASRMGVLDEHAAAGLAVVESSDTLGSGALGDYAINGDSTAETFLSVVGAGSGPALAALADSPEARAITGRVGRGPDPVPLTEAAALLRVVGQTLARRITSQGGSVLSGHTALHTQRGEDGTWQTAVRSRSGACSTLRSRNVVLATGGRQDHARPHETPIAGVSLAARAGERLVASDAILRHGGRAILQHRLGGMAAPRIVVVGSSTSALAACRIALEHAGARVTLVHRRKLRVFYPSAEAALMDGYTDFGPADICPVSRFVYRLAGFRMEARTMVQHALQVGGRAPHPRLAVHCMAGAGEQDAASLVDGADLVIYALGYRPRGLAVLDAHGRALPLGTHHGRTLVDLHGRMCDAQGQPVPGLFGLGLASGFAPSGALGGEPSFSGQANGLWLWQNDAGAMIVAQLGRHALRAAA